MKTPHTAADLAELDALLQRSMVEAGPFLRSSFQMPERSLSAAQLVRFLDEPKVVALATTTAQGAPRVAPLQAVFYRGRFHLPTALSAARVKQARKRPEVSLTYYETVELAIIAHGTAALVGAEHPDFAALNELYDADWFREIAARGDGVFLRVDARVLYTYASDPTTLPA